MLKVEAALQGYLKTYDSLSKGEFAQRRLAAKALYQYYQCLLLVIGYKFCGCPKGRLITFQLKPRWKEITRTLNLDETEINEWNKIIKSLNDVRNEVDHNDHYNPSVETLDKIRDKSEDFAAWLIKTAKTAYYKDYSLLQFLKFQLSLNKDHLNWKYEEYGDKPYITTEYEYRERSSDIAYELIPDISERVEKRLEEITDLKDFTTDDLELLLNLVGYYAELECREYIMISQGICPKCGGEIATTSNYFGGGYDEPPSGVYIRVGCKKCEYILNEESYGI